MGLLLSSVNFAHASVSTCSSCVPADRRRSTVTSQAVAAGRHTHEQDNLRRALPSSGRRSPHNLVFGGCLSIRTMMQSCASVARLLGGGPILSLGTQGPWATAGHRHLGSS